MIPAFSVTSPAFGLFDAGHDEALEAAFGSYSPSSAAHHISRDLSMLLYWDRSIKRTVVSDPERCLEFARRSSLLTRDCVLTSALTPDALPLRPWGLDRDLLRRLGKAGYDIPEALQKETDEIRRLQHRAFSSALLPLLLRNLRAEKALSGIHFRGKSIMARTLGETEAAIKRLGGRAVVKSPLSGSGRGIIYADYPIDDAKKKRIATILERQGTVECQKREERICDFAMEYAAETPGDLRLTGYSEFLTSESGAYTGNWLTAGSAEGREVYAMLRFSEEQKAAFERVVTDTLRSALPSYRGPLGIDMMICRSAGEPAVFPLVEMNFRRTMGMVVNSLGIHPDVNTTARFKITAIRDQALFRKQSEEYSKVRFLVKSASFAGDERYLQGYLPLTPIFPDTRFHACIFFRHTTGSSKTQ